MCLEIGNSAYLTHRGTERRDPLDLGRLRGTDPEERSVRQRANSTLARSLRTGSTRRFRVLALSRTVEKVAYITLDRTIERAIGSREKNLTHITFLSAKYALARRSYPVLGLPFRFFIDAAGSLAVSLSCQQRLELLWDFVAGEIEKVLY